MIIYFDVVVCNRDIDIGVVDVCVKVIEWINKDVIVCEFFVYVVFFEEWYVVKGFNYFVEFFCCGGIIWVVMNVLSFVV